jgi:hypothetical protein
MLIEQEDMDDVKWRILGRQSHRRILMDGLMRKDRLLAVVDAAVVVWVCLVEEMDHPDRGENVHYLART